MTDIGHTESNALVAALDCLGSGRRRRTETRGTVTRVDGGGNIWACFVGAKSDTPCARASVSARPGDIVTISVVNSRATVTGNLSSPATDDTSAKTALGNSARALQAANVAGAAAQLAVIDASRASVAAKSAENSAKSASASAESAAGDAKSAMESATSALTQLGTVEDVMGTLSWIHDHEVYVPATEFLPGETYYVLVDGKYAKVDSPVASDVGGYYVYDHQATMAGFVQEHLTLTERGLYITQSKPTVYEPGDSDYEGNEGNIRPFGQCYVLITTDATEYYGPTGSLIARYGRGVQLGDGEGGQVATIDNKTMHITRVEVTEELTVNNWVWQQRASGNISFKWRES